MAFEDATGIADAESAGAIAKAKAAKPMSNVCFK